jgi:drug/metabolite transporter (DMT)-like permease
VLLTVVFGRRGNPYRGCNIRLLVIRGCTGSAAFVCLVTAIRMLPVSTALVIFYSFPVFSALFSFLIYGERIGRYEIACAIGVLIGVGILFDFRMSGGGLGQFVALLAAIFAGLTVTLIKTLRENNGPVVIYLYFCSMGTLVTLPKFALDPVWPATSLEWVMILGIIFSSATAQLSMNQGFFYCRGWEGGVLMSSEVIFTALVGIVFLGDPAGWRFWAGGFLILTSAITMNRFKSKWRQPGVDSA